ncbi:hypothetical protein BGE01nite_10080 [Brevifollis gellanilyticus]|uniref:DUF11 domain-containing protein n=1 Tax=Brevifollis gellanilyticus TaxID=748831 RepID=A0A512M4R7_9BACT|nr:hypothetical protein BGE01nite_10080 [Brevifollis gellanilyticus]
METTATSGIFRNTTGLTTSTTTGSSQMDGTLLVAPGNSLSFVYTDPEFNETCTGTAVIAVPTQNKFLYLSDPSQALDRVDPVATSDATTASTATLGQTAGTITVVGAASTSNSSSQTPTSHTLSHNSGTTGSNRILMVGISYRDQDDETVTGVTYAAQAMTLVGTQNVDDSTSPDGRIYIYRLYNPPTGANNVVVTFSSALNQGSIVGAVTYAGVDLTGTPLGAFASTSTLTGSPNVNVPSAAGDLIFGVVAGRNAANYTITGGGTSLWASTPYTGQTSGAAQSKTGVATQTNISFGSGTSGNALLAAIGGVALKAAPSGTTTATFTQAPTFASTFTLPVGATPVVTAHYNVATGTMPSTPSITAVLKKNTTTFATSTSASASTSTGNGILTLNFGALASATNFAASDYVTMDITTAQSGVTFTVRFDSTTTPSKITLPTTTVIDVNTLGVYDAPYPAGNLITGLTSGTTVYVRSTASDPFGNADITSMGLAITGPGGSGNVSATLNGANVVATTTGTKTYEYAWSVGATSGTYNIAVTANEGTEGINATRATTVNVTMLDLGTPSTTHFTTGSNGPRTSTYAGGETVYVRVTDLDQNTNATVAETVTVTITSASGDSEVVTLTETGVNTGIFVGSIPASTTLGAGNNNGTLRAQLGELLTATYVDPTDSLDTSNDTATIPNVAPAVSVRKTLVAPADGIAVIGEALQYTVQVANTGNTTLSTIALTDTFPAANLTFVSASLTPSSTGSGTVSWTNVGPLTSGQSITITLNFTALSAGATVTNTASANAGGGVTGSSFANVTVTRPAHTITKTLISPNPGPANINTNVVFRISVQNTGTTAITTLPVEDLFSGTDFSFVSATTTPDAVGNGTLLWNDITGAGSLAAGATATAIDVTLKATGAAAPATNNASANYSVDANGDAVPAATSSTTITLVAAKITGRVYIDPDQSGTFNAGDSAFAGVTVSLYTDPNADGNPADGTLVAIVTTAADGLYEFPNLATGTYVIVESQPPGYSSSGDTQGANDNRIALNVSTLTTFANNNFFDYLTPSASYASISGKVWNDANANAAVTAGEVGIENVPVDLIEDSNNNGVADPGEAVVQSTLTAADGTYAFAGLSAGNYVVVERDLFGWYSTADVAAPNNNMIPVSAAAGSSTTGRDFLDVLMGTVGGKVYHDVDGNGSFGGSDTALANIDVIITNSFGVLQTVVTNASGDWTASVPPGTTNVNVDQTDAQFTAVFTTGYQQTAGTDPNNVTAASGVTTPAGDDGFRRLGSITGTVLADTDNNDTGDVGISGVTLTLKDSSGNDIDSNPGLAGIQPTTTTTNGSGVYTFSGVVHGTYQVVETDLAGYFSVTTNTVNPVNVVAGSTTSNVNFVDEQAGIIAGTVRADTDNNDTGDVGISGVTLTLKDSSGNDIDSDAGTAGVQPTITTTNGSGVYTFTNVRPGTYRVVETDPAGYFSVTTNTVSPVVVNAGATTSNINFVDEQAGSITGTVLADTDNNDTGDSPISGVTLTLKDSSGNDIDSDSGTAGVQPTTTTTNASGIYTFGNLLPGTYRVVETDPAGYFSVTPNTVSAVAVNAGAATSNINFVDEQAGSITGSVRADTDNNDTGDSPISGVTLTLKNSSGNDIDSNSGLAGIQPTTTTTNASGVYSFSNLLPGTYRVVETDPAGYFSVTTNTVSPVVVNAGAATSNINFVDEQAGSITGFVRADTNNDDTGDVGLNGVTLTLKDSSGNDIDSDSGTAGVQPTTTTTNASGAYTFGNLVPGTYRVVETDLAGYFSVTSNTVSSVAVNAGGTTSNINFVDEQAGSITGFVRADTDNNDTGDVGINGVTLTLQDSSGNDIDSDSGTPGVQPTTTTTNASGAYSFLNLHPGTYRVVETDPAGYLSITSNTVSGVVVSAGAATANVNFVDEQTGGISGTVLADTDNNDTGDTPVSGVTVTLKDSSGNDIDSDAITPGIQPTTAITNASGVYTFTGVPPGSYRVVETDLPGYLSLTPNTVSPVLVTAGAGPSNVNFVDEQTGSIAGTVRADTNNDDIGDNGINGVTLTLKDSSGNDIDSNSGTPGVQPTTTTTNVGGFYSFTNVPPGSYRVVETDPAGYLSVTSNTVSPVLVTAGNTTSGVNFVDEHTGNITGTVLADTDNDNTGDAPLSGVTLTLKDSSGNDIDSDAITPGVQPTTAITNASGAYTFTDVPPGSYRVIETDLPGYFSVSPDTVSPVLVTAAAVTSGVDFVDEQAGSITGTVLADADNDDDGDSPLSGVTLTLKDSSGNDIDSDAGTASIQPTTTTTNASGVYTFAGLRPGTYRVVETDPAGYFSVTSNTVSSVNVVAGTVTNNVNFIDEQAGSISGTVLADADNDDDGDTPISGVTLTLKDSSGNDIDSDAGAAGVQPTTTTTNGSGAYSFTNLVPGSYRVVETDLAGYFSVTSNTVSPVNVVAGTTTANVNFIDEAAGSISGSVLADTDNNDTGDSPLSGITLTLKDSTGADIDSDLVTPGVQPTTTTTDASGVYTFAGLRPGTYRVVETDPAGYVSITPNTVNPVVVAAGTPTNNVSFVDEQLSGITGTVLADTDNDDDGDDPISGVTLTLKNSSGNDIDSDPSAPGVQPTTAITNASGVYSFAGLTPGTYRVVETDLAGYFSVTTNTVSPVVVTAGVVTSGVNFIDEEAGSISGTVLADTDNDDDGDSPLSGITLTLKDSTGADIDSDPIAPGVQPTTTTTDASGVYTFAGLRPGTYRVVETDPAGYVSITPNTVNPVVVAAGTPTNNVSFVDEQLSGITGTVLADTDNDDDGDDPISGVTLTLKNSSGNDIDSDPIAPGVQPTTAITNAAGIYSFAGLTPGTYRVVETDLAGYFSVTSNTVAPVAVTAGVVTSGVNFIDEEAGSISGTVLADTDNDDDGDSPLSGITLTLKDSTGADIDSDLITPGVQPTTTTTDASGVYTFAGLRPGTYRVVETDPAGYFSVSPNTVSPVVVAAGTPTNNVSFIDEQAGSITGTVLADADDDDIGDDPISGVTLTLKDSNGDDIDSDLVTPGIQPTAATTNGSGVYTFANLSPGSYGVVETDLASYFSVTSNTVAPVAVTAGQATSGVNFIDEQAGSISGSVLADTDNDDMGDDPISGVTLTLKDSLGHDIDSDLVTPGTQPTTTTTNASGAYTFANLRPGTYRVVETDPAGYFSVSPNTVSPVVVAAGTPTNDVSFVDEQPGSISGTVLADLDNDDIGDTPISGVTLTLKDSNGDDIDSDLVTPGVQPTATTTDSNGFYIFYTFVNLAPGTYMVEETDLPGYFSVTTNVSFPVIVVAGMDTSDVNFVDEQEGSITGTVLADTDNDDDGDDPISGVTLTLKDSLGSDIDGDPFTSGIQPTEVTTNASGVYTFTGLRPGSYRVVETDPAGYLSITPNTVFPVDVVAATVTSGVDFVDEQLSGITGTVLADIDNDDIGDDPLSGVTLTLQDSNGNDIDSDDITPGVQPTTTTTDSNGVYSFANLSPGSYRVVQTDLAGYFSITPNTISPVVVTSGAATSGVNFIDEEPGSISGTVLADTDNNDMGDDPISGVTVTLKDSNGNDIDSDLITPGVQPTTAITNASGDYTFAGLPPGSYRVVETDPAGYFSVTPNTISPVLVAAGTPTTDVNYVDEEAGSITGTVLADTDNDDIGDDPISGVTITLKDSNGDDIDSDPLTAGVQPTTTTTNASGVYSFTNLLPGSYRVIETDPAGYYSVTPNTISPVLVAAGTPTADVNYVDEEAGSITGTVLADTDNDDLGDDPLSGVTLTLKDSNGDDIDSNPFAAGIQPTIALTNGTGAYLFAGLRPGTYRVVETDPAGYFSVTSNTVSSVNVAAGTTTTGVNFVDEEPGSISGTVMADTDNDDDGDAPINGVTLTLKDLNGDDIDSDPLTAGVQPTTTTTNASGAYTFTNVAPGSYLIVETDLAGYVSVTPNTVGPATVVAGAATTGADFVDEQTAGINGTVLADNDNDDLGDDPISGVTITLKDSNGDDIDSDPLTAGVQPTTTTTNASGAYSFSNLTPGNYRVVETDPAGYFSVTPNTLAPVIVLAGMPTNDVNFVDEEAGSITGTVLADADNDDDGDAPLSGVTLTLKDSSGNDIDSDDITPGVQPTTTTTDASGVYTFSGLVPGSYRVVETDLAGYFSVTPNTVTPVLVVAGTTTSDVSFVDEQAGSITGTVLADADNDDIGDDPLSSITLTLKDSNGDDIDSDDVTPGVQPTTTTTNASGGYSFTGLVPGIYRVVETDPAGYFSVTPNTVSPVEVAAGTVTSDVNFIDEEAGSISGSVLADTNNDDIGEDPISGVTLTLRDDNDNDIDSDDVTPGVQPTTTTTSGTGAYAFTGLRPGTYRVIQTDLPGYFSVTANLVSPVVVAAGTATNGVNFVDEQAGSISGSVLGDTDNDDDGDTPLSNVVLTLKDSSGNDIDSNDFVPGVQPTTATTDASGAYSFTGLRPGTYRVVETDPAGYFSVTPNTVANLSVVAGAETSGVNFVDEQPGSISGSVLADTDNDNDGDTPISGVTVTLKDSSGNDIDSDLVTPGVQPTTRTTNASGTYTFSNLLPGTYRVVETDPAGYFSVTPNTVSPVNVVAGTATTGINFVDEQPGSISGSVLADTDSDNDGDAPISGVTVTLKDSNGNDIDSDLVTPGVQPTNTTTNASGVYSFSNLLPGTYSVVETDPAGYLSVTPNTLNPVNVIAGTPTTGMNFVDEQFGSISGTVLADIDNDDDGDAPISGVTLTLKNNNGNDIDSDPITPGVQPTTTTTNASGAYSFGNLVPGNYRVVETDPAGYLSVTSNTVGPMSVAGGTPVTNANFIDEQSVTIGNLVWNDSDNDGFKDASESGINGVIVELLTGTGASIDSDALTAGIQPTTSTTASGGLYSFANVAPGLYRLRIATAPAGFPLSSTTTNTADDQQDNDDNGIQATASAATLSPVIELAAGEVDNTIDFGFAAISGTRTISGQVRDDYDLDGSLSDSDQPVPSVAIRLYADTNDNGVYDDGIDQLIRETMTDALGTYTFTGLPDGTYFVQEIDPEGATSTTDTQGSNDNLIRIVLNGSDSLGNDFLDAVDPAGYAYDVVTGQIISGGSIFISGPPGAGITILQDGSTGQYSFITDGTPGNYTLSYTAPTGYIIDPARPVAGASFDPTGFPDPHALGAGEDPMNPGYLTSSSAGANPYYFTFTLASGDPFVINNNIPLHLRTPRKYDYWKKITGSGPNPGSNGDGDCYTDLVEYALNLNPGTGVQTTPAFRGVRNTLTGKLDVSFNRISGGPDDVTYALMGIGALVNSPAGWNALSIIPTVTDNGDGTETVTYADVESDPFFTGQTQGFVRLYLELDENGDNIPEASANTPVFGWTRRLLNTECVMTGYPYLKDKNFCGTIDAVVGSTLNVATSAGGSSIVAQFAPGREYFVEIFSGDNAGHRFEINEAASTATTIALLPSHLRNTQTSIPANLTGDKAVIREHHTLNDLFPRTQFTATNNPSTGDRVLFYDRIAGQFKIYWLYSNSGNPKWLLTNDATLTDYSSLIVDPSDGWFTHPKGVPQQVVWHGMVRANAFACPLAQGPNFIGSAYPMDQSPAMRGMTTAAGFIGSRDPTKADELLFWKGYTSTQTMAYYNHFLLSAGALQQWTELNNASLVNENNLLMFKATAGALYKMRTGLATYVMPMPWTP